MNYAKMLFLLLSPLPHNETRAKPNSEIECGVKEKEEQTSERERESECE